MSIRDYDQIMNQVKNLPVNQVALGGGNPNQHPDFCEILRSTREEYGIVPSYTTNGRGLTQDVIESSRNTAVQWQSAPTLRIRNWKKQLKN